MTLPDATFPSCKALADFIQTRFQSLSNPDADSQQTKATRLGVHALMSPVESRQGFVHELNGVSTLHTDHCRRLILVFEYQLVTHFYLIVLTCGRAVQLDTQNLQASATSSSSADGTMPVVVAGLYCQEFITSNTSNMRPIQRTINLSKLDTTGLLHTRACQRDLVRSLVCAYIDFMALRTQIPLHIYVTAKQNPEYLFPLSQQLPAKHSCKGRSLVYWWKETLDGIMKGTCESHSLGIGNVEKYWIVPGLELNDIPLAYRGDNTWKWGLSILTGSAWRFVPRFEEDPVSACLERSVSGDESVSVPTFVGILACAPEFKGASVGVLSLTIPPLAAENASSTEEQGTASDAWQMVMDRLNLNPVMVSVGSKEEEDDESDGEDKTAEADIEKALDTAVDGSSVERCNSNVNQETGETGKSDDSVELNSNANVQEQRLPPLRLGTVEEARQSSAILLDILKSQKEPAYSECDIVLVPSVKVTKELKRPAPAVNIISASMIKRKK
jgi:hypothetical protein